MCQVFELDYSHGLNVYLNLVGAILGVFVRQASKERSTLQQECSRASTRPRSYFVALLPLLLTVLGICVASAYFFAEKLDTNAAENVRTGSVGTDGIEEKAQSTSVANLQDHSHEGGAAWGHLVNSVTRCQGEYAYAGTNGHDFVSICATPEGLLYQAYVANGILRKPAHEIGPGSYQVDAGAHRIHIEGPRVRVVEPDGEIALVVDLPDWHERQASQESQAS
ncbi:hypothetical protein CPPEL_09795 [Corynebacterium pseudopelargi]|uniref:Uncharacterized protein n=1 Tax=Corynebacterium pseudopelargi TaxID=2080757 RepID=A0A3G6IWI0_9CORY|nr:hypothetical protein CPPEL_09795 [Corynebacterium pseudopelargi]